MNEKRREEIRRYKIAALSFSIIAVVLGTVLAYQDNGIVGAMWVILVAAAIGAFVALMALLRS